MSFYDRVKTNAATGSGTGNFTWTTADNACALPPASINETVIYTIVDATSYAWETGRAVLSESGGTYTLTRGGSQIVTASSNSGSAVTFTTNTNHSLILTPDAQYFDVPRTSLSLASNQSISDATWTEVEWDTEDLDDLSTWVVGSAADIVTPAGVTHAEINCYVVWVNSNTGLRYLQLLLDGTTFQVGVKEANLESALQIVSRRIAVQEDEVITAQVYQTAGTLNLSGTGFGGPSFIDVKWF